MKRHLFVVKYHAGRMHASVVQQRNMTVDHIRNIRRDGGRSPAHHINLGFKGSEKADHDNVAMITEEDNAT
jgi:hypothetical protein